MAEMAFQNHRGGRPLCPLIIARNIATLIAANLHPLGGPEIWSGNPMSTTLTLSIPITTDDDGCPTPTQPYTRVNRILRKLIPLWEHNLFTWEQIARRSPNKRPWLLSDEKILWANPHLRNIIPNTLHPMGNPPSPQTSTSRLPRTPPLPHTHTFQTKPPIHILHDG